MTTLSMARSAHTLEELLREADQLLRDARKKRKEADRIVEGSPAAGGDISPAMDELLKQATGDLLKAKDLIEPELRLREAAPATETVLKLASRDRSELATRLADIYGPLGGIARRRGEYQEALDFYEKGKELELNPAYGVKSTYNRVQWIVMKIFLDPSTLDKTNSEVEKAAQDTLRLLQESIVRDAWTSADVILLSAILRDRRQLRRAWNDLVETKPTEDVYKSGLLVLRDLAQRLPNNDTLQRAVSLYESGLSGNSSGS
jgi:tetratricopeptide (TPR) repeat protein